MRTSKLSDFFEKMMEHPQWLICGVLAICFAPVLIFILTLCSCDFADSPDDFSAFGDYVGGVIGAVTGAIGVIFLFLTYGTQLKMFKKQKEQADIQQFETNFFQLLNSQRTIAQNLKCVERHCFIKTFEYNGLAAVHKIRVEIEEKLQGLYKDNAGLFNDTDGYALDLRDELHNMYQSVFEPQAAQLGHYFRSLYHVLKFIQNNCPAAVDYDSTYKRKKMYFDIVQALMSTDELYLTCINGISNYGRKKMFPLLDDFSFLENLVIDADDVIKKVLHIYYKNTIKKNINGKRPNVILLNGSKAARRSRLLKRLTFELWPYRQTSFERMLIRRNSPDIDNVNNHIKTLTETIDQTVDSDYIYVIDVSFCVLTLEGERERLSNKILDHLNIIGIVTMSTPLELLYARLSPRYLSVLDNTSCELYLENIEDFAEDYADYKDVPNTKVDCDDTDAIISAIRKMASKYE